MEFHWNCIPINVWTEHLRPDVDRFDFVLGCKRMSEAYETLDEFVAAAEFVKYIFEWFWHASGRSSEIMSLLCSAFAEAGYPENIAADLIDIADFVYWDEDDEGEACRAIAEQFRSLHRNSVL